MYLIGQHNGSVGSFTFDLFGAAHFVTFRSSDTKLYHLLTLLENVSGRREKGWKREREREREREMVSVGTMLHTVQVQLTDAMTSPFSAWT